jgi:hypothetical protein
MYNPEENSHLRKTPSSSSYGHHNNNAVIGGTAAASSSSVGKGINNMFKQSTNNNNSNSNNSRFPASASSSLHNKDLFRNNSSSTNNPLLSSPPAVLLPLEGSDHSNLTMSSLQSLETNHSSFPSPSRNNNKNSDQNKLSIDPTQPSSSLLLQAKYKAMSSPDLKMIMKNNNNAFESGEGGNYPRPFDSAGSESTAERSASNQKNTDISPSSPLRLSRDSLGNSALLSPIKLLELASVCSERQEQEQQQQQQLSQLSQIRGTNLSSQWAEEAEEDNNKNNNNNNGNNKIKS